LCICCLYTEGSDGIIVRHGVNSGIGIAYLKKNGIGIDKFGIEVCYKKSYLEHKLLGLGIPSRYSEYLLQSVVGIGTKWNWN